MNKSYICSGQDAIIADQNGKQTKIEYCDNLDEILVQENVVEEITNKLKNLSEKINHNKTVVDNSKYMMKTLPLLGVGIGILVSIFDTISGRSVPFLFFPQFGLAISLPFEVTFLSKIWVRKGEIKGDTVAIAGLEHKLSVEKSKLEELRKTRTFGREKQNDTDKVITIDDSKQLNEIEESIQQYISLGYRLKDFYEKYPNVNPREYLPQYFNMSQDDLEFAAKYVEEKGPTLIRRR